MAGGRPSEYDPKFCDLVVSLGGEGKFPVEWAAEIGVTKKCLLGWKLVHPEFCDAYDIAFTKCESEHMSKSRNHANTGTGSPALIKWLGSAVFGYREAMDVENTLIGKDGGPIQQSLTVEYIDAPKE